MISAPLPELDSSAPAVPVSRLPVATNRPRIDTPLRRKKPAALKPTACEQTQLISSDCYSIALYTSSAVYGAVSGYTAASNAA
jgi:hypothetical protein